MDHIEELRKRLDYLEKWHNRAGEALYEMQKRIDYLRDFLEKMERDGK